MRIDNDREDLEKEAAQYEEVELKEIISEGEKFEQLKTTPGWKIIEEQLFLRLKSYGNILMTSKEPIVIHQHQGKMQEVNSILSFIDSGIEAKKEAVKELDNK